MYACTYKRFAKQAFVESIGLFLGKLYDLAGNYEITLYVGGMCLVASSFLHFFLYLPYFKPKLPELHCPSEESQSWNSKTR